LPPEPIPYDEFVQRQAEARQALKPARAQSSAPSAVPAMDWAKRLLAKKQSTCEKGEFVAGTIFVPDDLPTNALYRMLAAVNVPAPETPLIKSPEHDTFLTFLNYIKETHGLFQKHVWGRNPVHDDVIHRISFVFTLGIPQSYGYGDVRSLFDEGKQRKQEKEQIWTPILRIIREDFIDHGFGWRWETLESKTTWKAELRFAAEHKIKPREILFPSFHAAQAKRDNDMRLEKEEAKRKEDTARHNNEARKREEQQKAGTYVRRYHIDMNAERLISNQFYMNNFSQGLLMGMLPNKAFIEAFLQSKRSLSEAFFDALQNVTCDNDEELHALYDLVDYLKANGINRDHRSLRREAVGELAAV
jgi:hypothetical protein